MATAAITIDVDSLRFYRQIHGLGSADPAEDPIYRTAVPRFFELLEEARLPATLFLIGEDAGRHAEAFGPIRALRCEVASHSFSHDYRLTTRSDAEIDRELERAEEVLGPLSPDGRIEGFRAPGYNVSPALLARVVARGYRYDSSLLPAPAYWAARAAAIGRYRLAGRPSRSLVGRARAFAGPLGPYRTTPARPWEKSAGGALLEIPIACEPTSRLPLIGTTWSMLPKTLRRVFLGRALRKLPCINFEMHAIDLLDRTDRGISSDLAAAQPDLAVPARQKMAAFRDLFRHLSAEREVRTLAAIARGLSDRASAA